MTPYGDAIDDLLTHAHAWASALRLAGQMAPGPIAKMWEGCAERLTSAGESDEAMRVRAFRESLPMLKAAIEAAGAAPEDANYWHHEMKAVLRVEKALQGHHLAVVTLSDWRIGCELEPDDPAIAEPVPLSIGMDGSFLDIKTSDGRSISIELEADRLRVLSYNVMKDEPLTVEIPTSDKVSVDDRDYQAGALLPPAAEEVLMAPGA